MLLRLLGKGAQTNTVMLTTNLEPVYGIMAFYPWRKENEFEFYIGALIIVLQ
jgi:hypothetical protein